MFLPCKQNAKRIKQFQIQYPKHDCKEYAMPNSKIGGHFGITKRWFITLNWNIPPSCIRKLWLEYPTFTIYIRGWQIDPTKDLLREQSSCIVYCQPCELLILDSSLDSQITNALYVLMGTFNTHYNMPFILYSWTESSIFVCSSSN